MKKFTVIIIVSMFLILACATSVNVTPKVGDAIAAPEIVESVKEPESFAHCMRYDEDITLTAKEELALLEHCLKL